MPLACSANDCANHDEEGALAEGVSATEFLNTRSRRCTEEMASTDAVIEAELQELRKTLEQAVSDSKLITCVPSSIRVEIV